jgi:GNAT superfamily N-acetyltransferase
MPLVTTVTTPQAALLRLAGPEDVEAVRALARSAYAKWIPVIGREPMPMVADYARAVREHRIDLFETEGKLAALIETIAFPDHLFIENVAVSPEAQGRGYGRLLMGHAEEVARALGLITLRLLTNKAFEANVQLYLKLGYRIDREEPFREGYTVYMSKELAAT